MSLVSVPWTRSENGAVFGVCQGLAKRFELDVMLIRIAFVIVVLMGGAGIAVYLCLAIGLPREDSLQGAMDPRIMGVCSRFARRFDLDVGLVRSGALFCLLCTAGTVFIVYLVLYFILPTEQEMAR